MSSTRQPRSSRKKKPDNGGFSTVDLGDIAELAKRIPQLDDEEKRTLIRQLKPQQVKAKNEIEKEQQERATVQALSRPRNDDELHALILRETGYDIPRVAVCHDHCAPFDVVADAYFNRYDAILVLGSRESGKTLNVSILHYINAETRPGCEACTFGAVQSQAKRAYKHVKSFIYTRDERGNKIPKPQIEGDPTRTETNWRTGSIIEIIVGTVAGVNSPHPHVVHADEVDLMEEEVWSQSRNMSSSGKGTDGKFIPALDIATSTRKSMRGLMQKLIDQINDAIRKGHKPPWKLYSYCVGEIAAEVPSCRCADPIERVHRLVKLGRDPRELCECATIVNGEWREGVDRTFESVCRGRFFRSRGWMPYSDIVRKFMQNTQTKWDAEMECRRPMADGLYLENFTRQRYTMRGWVPRPEYGRITQGIDWGGAANSVVVWIQGPLINPVEIPGFEGQPIIVPQNAYVIFDQIEAARTGATLLADMVCAREAAWRAQFPHWRVRGRFADMAGAQQRADWAEHSPPLRTQWYISRDFDPTVDAIQGLVDNGLLYVDITRCSSLCDDFESWRSKDGREVRDDSTHGPAACLVAGTMIATKYGKIPIEDVRVGDEVWTRAGLCSVQWSGRSKSEPQPVYRVRFSDGSELIGTEDHPVWVQDQGFVHLAALRYGDRVLLRDESVNVYVTSVEDLDSKEWVYDLSIEDQPEFFANGVLAHNSRYGLANVIVLERRDDRQQTASKALPVVKERASLDSGALAAVASSPSTSVEMIQTEQWRRSYGMLPPSGNSGADGWRNV